jgi:hypothetical protein
MKRLESPRVLMEVGEAVFEGRAIHIPLDSPNYASFVRAMNEPAMPREFLTHGGAYIPSDADNVCATLDAERLEEERLDARWEALAQEALEIERLTGCLTEDDMLAIGACG